MVPNTHFGRRTFLAGTGATVAGTSVIGLANGRSKPVDIVTAIRENGEAIETERVTQD